MTKDPVQPAPFILQADCCASHLPGRDRRRVLGDVPEGVLSSCQNDALTAYMS